MKIPFVTKSYTFHRFNEITNTIEDDHSITVTRHMKPAEIIRYHRLRRDFVLWLVLTVLLWVAAFALMGCALGCVLPDWCAGIGIAFIGLTYIAFMFVLEFRDDTRQLLMRELSQTGFEDEDAAYKTAEDKVKNCAEVWQTNHIDK